jgi:formylglycine-generating enzyme required for sulfatase activity
VSGRRFPWGDTIDHTQANYNGYPSGYAYDTGYEGYDTRYNDGVYPYTSPVGSFPANGYGLHDMAGNVWEWCWDWWGETCYSSSAGSDPTGPSSGDYRLLRGGGWGNGASRARYAFRDYAAPVFTWHRLGFRCVRR